MPHNAYRLNRVEKALGALLDCHCGPRGGRGSRFYIPDNGEARPSEICEQCGGGMIVIEVVREKPEFQNYAASEGYE